MIESKAEEINTNKSNITNTNNTNSNITNTNNTDILTQTTNEQTESTEKIEEAESEIIIPPKHDSSFISSASESSKLDLNKRTKFNKQMDLNCFFKKSRHFFIMTEGGKPVYSRYGDEYENCGILATFSAIITKFTFFNNPQGNEKLHYILTQKTTTVFLKKGKLILIALSKKKDTISLLTSQLEYLFIQLVSIITNDRIARLENNPSYCSTAMLDTEEMFEQMITYSTHTLISLLNSFHTIVIDSNARNRLYSICNDNKGEALLTLLLTPYELIVICKNELIPEVVCHDVILIQNLIFSSESLRQTESLVPICLPGISDSGYLQLYCKFLEQNIALVFITESQELSYFLKFAEQSQIIYDMAVKENLIESIKSAIHHKNKSVLQNTVEINKDKLIQDFYMKMSLKSDNNNQVTNSNHSQDPFNQVKYLICKNKNSSQLFTFKFNNFDKTTKEENKVLKAYCNMYDIYNSNLLINSNNFFHFEKSEKYTHVVLSNENYLLFCSFNFFKEFEEINHLCQEILKMIKHKESYFYINKY